MNGMTRTLCAAIRTAAILACCTAPGAWALDLDATMANAETLLDKGDFDGALRAADEAVKAAGSNPEAFHCRFRVYLARAQDQDALADINRAIQLAPANAKYLAARAELRVTRGEFEAALTDLDAAIDADDAYAPAYRLRAALAVRQARPELALGDAMKAIELAPDDAIAYVVRGDALSITKEYDKARADYVQATEVDPKCVEAWRALGLHDLLVANTPARARDAFDKVIALDPAAASAYVTRAKAKLATADASLIASALEDATEAIRLNPDDAEAHFTRAAIKRERQEYAAALADLRSALALEPANATYRQLWDTIHTQDSERLMDEAETLLNEGKYDEAAGRVQKALEIDPTSEAFHEALHIIDTRSRGR